MNFYVVEQVDIWASTRFGHWPTVFRMTQIMHEWIHIKHIHVNSCSCIHVLYKYCLLIVSKTTNHLSIAKKRTFIVPVRFVIQEVCHHVTNPQHIHYHVGGLLCELELTGLWVEWWLHQTLLALILVHYFQSI